MPRNSYGPDDPETSLSVRSAPEDVTLFTPDPPLLATCRYCNKAPGVTMVEEAVVEGRLWLKAACAACAKIQGERVKGEILKRHSERRKATLDWLHGEMRELYDRRVEADPSTAWVTVVDARRAYRRMPEADATADLRFMGSLFRSRGWQRIEGKTVKNSDEGNHARPVDCWRFVQLGVKSR